MLAHGQTIVYAVHESIGHLGIFVSGSVARKEHQEFTSNIDMIDVLPPGIYQAEIADKTPDTPNADLAQGNYVLSFEERHLDDVRAIVDRKEDDDRRFAAVARISDINLGMYRSFVQPWLRATVTPQSAEWLQRLHPLRLPYELISDRNPLVSPIARVAEQVREHRQPVSSANPFLMTQEMVSNWIETSLNIWQELRDSAAERSFMSIYGSPVVQDLAGLGAQDGRAAIPAYRPNTATSWRPAPPSCGRSCRKAAARGRRAHAAVRGRRRGWPGRTQFRADPQNARRIKQRHHAAGIQDLTRDQALMLTLDAPAAIQAMPRLLEGETPAAIRTALDEMKRVLEAAEPLSAAARKPGRNGAYLRGGRAPRRASRPRRRRATQGRGRARPRRRASASRPPWPIRHRARRSGREAGRQAHRAVTALAAGTGAKASTKAATKTASKTTTPTAAKSAAPANPPTTRPSRNEPAVLHALRQAHRPRPDAVGRALRHRPPCDEPSLSAALEARDLGLLHPILVGPERKIRDTAAQFRLNLGDARIVDAPHSHAAAETAVALVRAGEASLLMKGSLHTDELMHEVVARNTGLRSSRRISHVFIMEVPTYPEPLFITDAAINIFPDLETKADIIRNVIDLHHGLGLGEPRVAILSAVEQVTPSIPSTIEAAALCKMADRGQIAGGLLDGPLALDNAISPDAARIRAYARTWRAWPRCWWCRTWRPATCWPRTSPSWPMPRPPASCWARACPSS